MTPIAAAMILVLSSSENALRASAEAPLPSWSALLDTARSQPALESARSALVVKARELAALPLVRRAYTLEDVGKHRTWLDGRSAALEDEIREVFALAMSDFAACNTLAGELPLLAAAYRLTGEEVFRDRVIAQLEEMGGWSPLQRPGWTCYTPGNRLPPDGKDGNWLATGCGVRALGDTLDLLPEGTLDKALLDKLHRLLDAEIAGVVDDWAAKRPWFVRSNNPVTNQWVLPTEGLVRACLILGIEDHREAYDLGVKNLLMALDAHGPKGEFEEGFGYASFTVTSMLHAAHAMAAAGDRRAVDHPFLKHFPAWLVHHFQPGNMVINCFDAGGAYNAAEGTRPLLSLLAVCTASPVARWALAHQTSGPSDDLPGLAARALPPVAADAAPPLFAQYERAARVNWRSSWRDDADGVWVRGGHALDQHDHQDRGHVNYIARGIPILIEAGTPSYHHPRMMTHYTSGAGHNVLQLGIQFPEGLADAGKRVTLPGWQKAGGLAPITVRRLDATGGEVLVDATACYDGLARWHRTVSWNVGELVVVDDVALTEGTEDIVLFRWHLGTADEVSIREEEGHFRVAWPGAQDGQWPAEILLESTVPLSVAQIRLPDNTLAGHDGSENPRNSHTCLTVRSREKVRAIRLTTQVAAK